MRSIIQTTLRRPVYLSGVGIHSNKVCRLAINPTSEPGIVFLRHHPDDVPDASHHEEYTSIPALYDSVSHTHFSTTLSSQEQSVRTVEHLMAALWGLGITNAEVEVEGGDELPILDGSSAKFVEALLVGGKKMLWQGHIPVLSVTEKVEVTMSVGGADAYASLEPSTTEHPSLDATIDVEFDAKRFHGQRNRVSFMHDYQHVNYTQYDGERPLKLNNNFVEQIAPARTFAFESEVKTMHRLGLGLGGTLDNCVVYPEADVIPLNPEGLRFSDEWARHKMLDCLGDLSLVGGVLNAKFYARCPGHELNQLLLRELFRSGKYTKALHG